MRVGRLGRPHGLGGFLGFYLEAEHLHLVQPGASVLVGPERYLIRALRRTHRGYQVAFEGVSDRRGAESIRGFEVYAESGLVTGDDQYWPEQLQGLTVVDQGGVVLGVVSAVVFGAAQDRIEVTRPGGGTFQVPFVAALVPAVDLERGRIEIVDLPGLSGRSG